VIVDNPDEIAERFMSGRNSLKPRHMRDIARLISLIKAFALLNFMHRQVVERRKGPDGNDGIIIRADRKDVESAFKVWSLIDEPQELGVPPFVYQVFKQVIEPLAERKSITDRARGPTIKEIMRGYLEVFGRPISRAILEREILPSLEAAGLITIEPHPDDRRKKVIIPTTIPQEM